MKKQAITLIEILISITILSMLMILLFSIITKKTKSIAEKTSGTFYCYKDIEGKLNQKVELSDGTVQELSNIESCNFNFPQESTDFTVYVIGGGGGGGELPKEEFEGKKIVKDELFYEISSEFKEENKIFNEVPSSCLSTSGINIPVLETQTNMETCTETNSICWKCTNGNYICPKSNTSLTGNINTSNTLPETFEDNAYQKLVLEGRTLFVKGGNSDSELGTECSVNLNLQLNTNIKMYDGIDEYPCEKDSLNPTKISATPGIIEVNNSIAVIAPGAASSQITPNKYVNSEKKCVINGTKRSTINSGYQRNNDILKYKKITPKLYYGTGGNFGSQILSTNLKLGGKNIIIPKNNIGNGGQIGQNGEDTTFEEYYMTAQGGKAGETNHVLFNNEPAKRISLSDLVYQKNRYILNINRQTGKTIEGKEEEINGKVSDYTNKMLETIVLQERDSFKGVGAKCDAINKICEKSTSPKTQSIGSGGGGANSMLVYDPISEISYEKYNCCSEEKYEKVLDSATNLPRVIHEEASPGMGGGIVIKW